MKHLNELIELNEKVNKVFNSDIDWEVKYDFIFSADVSRRINQIVHLDYYDPDTSYEEDVTAFVNAFNNKMIDIRKLAAVLEE